MASACGFRGLLTGGPNVKFRGDVPTEAALHGRYRVTCLASHVAVSCCVTDQRSQTVTRRWHSSDIFNFAFAAHAQKRHPKGCGKKSRQETKNGESLEKCLTVVGNWQPRPSPCGKRRTDLGASTRRGWTRPVHGRAEACDLSRVVASPCVGKTSRSLQEAKTFSTSPSETHSTSM